MSVITVPIWCCPFLQPTAHRHGDECGERADHFLRGTSPLAQPNYFGDPLPPGSEPIYTNEYAAMPPIRVPHPDPDTT